MEKRSVIQTIHVKFDDFISFSKIRRNSDDFNYTSFDFSRINEKDFITYRTAHISFSEMVDGIGGSIKIDKDKINQNVKSDEKSVFPQSRDKDLTRDFANMKINQQLEQLEQFNQSTFLFQSFASGRFFTIIFKLNHVKLNNSDYKFRDCANRGKNAIKNN